MRNMHAVGVVGVNEPTILALLTRQSLIGRVASCMDEDKKKTKKWKKKKGEVAGGPDLRLHRAETAHVSSRTYRLFVMDKLIMLLSRSYVLFAYRARIPILLNLHLYYECTLFYRSEI